MSRPGAGSTLAGAVGVGVWLKRRAGSGLRVLPRSWPRPLVVSRCRPHVHRPHAAAAGGAAGIAAGAASARMVL